MTIPNICRQLNMKMKKWKMGSLNWKKKRFLLLYINDLLQMKRNSSANALGLRLFRKD